MQRKRPLHGKIFARCIPKRLFAGLFGCMARISCQSQLISDAWRANLATKGRFSRPRPLSGYMERKTCHGLPPGDAFRVHFAIVERPGNAYPQRLANRAASSCGRAYCLAIALVPHESDGLFVQAVLCARERSTTSCAWRRHIVAMAGNRTEGRGTLSRTWRDALNAGIRAEGADDKLAHALHPNRLAPFVEAGLPPSTNRPQHRCETWNEPAGQANIERLR